MDSVFYYPVTLHQGNASGSVVAPWVTELPLAAPGIDPSSTLVVLVKKGDTLSNGMYLWTGASWRLVIPYLTIAQAIIAGSSIEVFYQMSSDYSGLPSNTQLWKNAVAITGSTVTSGLSVVWGAVYTVSPSQGDVRSVSNQAPDSGGNVTIQAVDNSGTGTSLIVSSGATTGNIKLRKLVSGTNISLSVDANNNLVIGSSSVGTVTEVALSLPSMFNVSGSPVTTTGTLTAVLASQNAKTFLSGPASGSADIPTFRVLQSTDLPVATAVANGAVSVGAGLSVTTGGLLSANMQSFNGRTGTVTLQLTDVTGAGGAPLNSPAFTGTPTAPTPPLSDDSIAIATTAFVRSAIQTYSVGPATTTALGTVIVGNGLNVSAGGNLTLAPATSTALGGVVVPAGSGLAIDVSGNISNAGVTSFNARTGPISLSGSDLTTAGGALIASPAFTGTPTAPTPVSTDNSTRIATTAYVQSVVSAGTVTSFNTRIGAVTLQAADVTGVGGALLASPAFTGVPTAPTAATGTNTDQIATTAFVQATVLASGVATFNGRSGAVTLQAADVSGVGGALLDSPAFTGTPTSTTPVSTDNSTRIATTAYVQSVMSSLGVTSFNTRTGAITLTTADITGAGGAPLDSPAFTGTPTVPDLNLTTTSGTQVANYDTVYAMVGGSTSYTVAGGSNTMPQGKYSYAVIQLTGSPSSPPTIVVPSSGKWVFVNPLPYAATISTGTGSTVVIPSGETWEVAATSSGVIITTTVATTQSTSDNSQRVATTAFVHSLINSSGVSSFNTRTGAVTLQASDITGAGGALLDSPAFTGVPTAPTAVVGNNSTQLATTAYIQNTLLNTEQVSLASTSSVTLTNAQYGSQIIEFTGVLSASVTVVVPSSGQWTMYNNTTGAFNVTLSNGAGATYVVPQNESAYVMSLGSLGVVNGNIAGNVITPATASTIGGVIVPNGSGLTVDASGNLSVAAASGSTLGAVKQGTGVTIAADGTISANVTSVAGRTGAVTLAVADVSGAAPLAGPAFTGVPTAPTAAPGTNTTQIATTAFVQAAFSSSSVTSFNTRTGAVTLQAADVTGVGGALLASPAFTGTPTAPTAAIGDNSTTLATTNYVYGATQGVLSISLNGFASANSFSLSPQQYSYSAIQFTGTLGGNPTVTFPTSGKWTVYNTASDGGIGYQVKVTNGSGTTYTLVNGVIYTFLSAGSAGLLLIATTATVYSFNGRTGSVTLQAADVTGVGGALLASPAFTGTPTAPTAAVGTSTTQLATTAFVATSFAPLASPALTGTPTTPTATAGTNNTQIASTSYVYNATQGSTSIPLTTGTTTLTAAQYSVPILVLTGTLTGNCTIDLPTSGDWIIDNTCTMGTFTITLTNGSGATVSLGAGALANVVSNGSAGVLIVSAGASSPTFTGRATIPAETFAVNQLGNVSGTVTMDQSLYGEFTLTVTGNTTINLTNPPSGGQVTIIRMANGGSATLTWPANTKFANATAPTYTTSGIDVFVVLYDVVTSTYMVFVVGQAIG